jgi:LPXTG-motif cell wall-anchored protein
LTQGNDSSGDDQKSRFQISASDFLIAGVFAGISVGGGVALGYWIGNITNTGFVSVGIGLVLGLLVVFFWFRKKIQETMK